MRTAQTSRSSQTSPKAMGETEPVLRTVHTHESGAVQIADDPIVLYWLVGHSPSDTSPAASQSRTTAAVHD